MEIIQKDREYAFDGISAPNINFSNVNAIYASFRGVKMENADFTGSNLHGADFTDACLTNACFRGANCNDTIFTGADISHSIFDETDLFRVQPDGNRFKTMYINPHHITILDKGVRVQIGMQQHSWSEWLSFSEKDVDRLLYPADPGWGKKNLIRLCDYLLRIRQQ